MMSLGRQTALADLLFVRAHAYFLSHFFTDRIFAWLDPFYDAIVGLDPDNPAIYLWAARVVKFGQIIDDGVVRRADAYLEQGIARFPEDWRLHLDLGFNLYFEYRGRDEAERAAARLRARDHFGIAAGLPGAQMDANFVAEVFERDREEGLAASYALQKYYESSDEQRTQLARRVSAISQELAAGLKREEARWKAELPFLPISLFSLTGGRLRGNVSPALVAAVAEGR